MVNTTVSMATTSKDNPLADYNRNSTCYSFDNSITAIIGQFLMAFAILLLNGMVVAVICRNRRKTFRKPAFIFIVALATTDMLLAGCLFCFSFVSIANLQLSTNTWVNLTASTSVCFNASVNFLFVIALDRLCHIAYNRSYSSFMKKRTVVVLIVICWVVGMLPVLPLFFWNVGSCADYCSCSTNQFLTCDHSSCSTVVKGFTKRFLFGLFFYFLTMLLSISMIYTILFVKVHHHGNRVRHCSSESFAAKGRSARMRREFRLARTLSLVVITFFLCWSPLMILYVVDYAHLENFSISTIVAQTVTTPAIFNSMLNPIIYAARIPILKSYFCFCGCNKNKNNSVDRKRKSSGSSSRKTSPQCANMQTASNTKANHIWKRSEKDVQSSFSSTHLESQVTNNICAENTSQKERMNSWPASTVDSLLMKTTSSTSSNQRFKSNCSCGVETNFPQKKFHTSNVTPTKRMINESSVIEASCHLTENQ